MDSPASNGTGTVVSIERLNSALAEIPDIDAFHVVANGHGIEEIHIVSTSSKSPKQLVRDIESLLLARHKISIDRKVISIAQMGAKLTPLLARPLISGITVDAGQGETRVDVKLSSGDSEFVGTAQGPSSRSTINRLVAEATLGAVSKLSKQAIAFALDDATIVTLSREKVALVGLSIVGKGHEQLCCGSAIVKHDEKDAIARSTLDAVNRRLSFLTIS